MFFFPLNKHKCHSPSCYDSTVSMYFPCFSWQQVTSSMHASSAGDSSSDPIIRVDEKVSTEYCETTAHSGKASVERSIWGAAFQAAVAPVVVTRATAGSSLRCRSESWFMAGDRGAGRLKAGWHKPCLTGAPAAMTVPCCREGQKCWVEVAGGQRKVCLCVTGTARCAGLKPEP